MEHVNGWCFRGIYNGGLWENDLHVSALSPYREGGGRFLGIQCRFLGIHHFGQEEFMDPVNVAVLQTCLNMYTWAATWQNQQSECAPSEDSDQPGYPPSLISLRCALNGQLRAQAFFMRTAKTDQFGRMPRLIWVIAGRTTILLVLSWGGSCMGRGIGVLE